MESTMEDGMETQVHRDTSGTWSTDFQNRSNCSHMPSRSQVSLVGRDRGFRGLGFRV